MFDCPKKLLKAGSLTLEQYLAYMIYLGSGEVAGHKSVMGYSIDFSNKGHIGRLVHSTQFWVDPTFVPFRKAGEERVMSLSSGKYLSAKEEFEQERPTSPAYEQ